MNRRRLLQKKRRMRSTARSARTRLYLQRTVASAFANVMRAIEHGDSAAVLDSAVLVLRRKIGERDPGTSKAPSY